MFITHYKVQIYHQGKCIVEQLYSWSSLTSHKYFLMLLQDHWNKSLPGSPEHLKFSKFLKWILGIAQVEFRVALPVENVNQPLKINLKVISWTPKYQQIWELYMRFREMCSCTAKVWNAITLHHEDDSKHFYQDLSPHSLQDIWS